MKYPLFLSREEIYNGHYSIKKRDATCEFTRDLHYHDFYEIQFYLSDINSERDRTNTALSLGEITVSEETLPLVHGSLVLINMFEPHQIQITCEQPYIRYCISFDSSLLLFACSDTSNLFNIFSSCARSGHVRRLTSGQILDLISICRRYETLSMANGRDIMEKSIILEIFAYIYNIFYDGREISPFDTRNMEIITNLISYIDEHISGDLSLEHLADSVSFSPFYLSRMFRRYTGATLNQYVIAKRIDKAKLLLAGSVSAADAGRDTGFHSYAHFYRTFKKITGMSPTEYQKRE